MHVLFALQTAFSLWMLVDAAKRGAGYVWYMIIMMPFGEIAYFLAVKIHDPSFGAFTHGLFHRPPSLRQIRFNAEQIPSVENRLMLARALHDAGLHPEAIQRFRELLALDPEDKAVLHGLGCSLLEAGETSAAIDTLEALAALDFKYADYAAGSMLCLVSSVAGGGKYNFPHLVALESIREALDRKATTGGEHKKDWEIGIHYTGNRDDAGNALGSIALVISPSGRRRLWYFGDGQHDDVDLGQGRHFVP